MVEKFFKKVFQFGLGVADLTKEETKRLVNELDVDHNTKEGRKMVDNFLKQGKEASVKLEKKIEVHAKKLSSNFVTKKDLDRVEKKLDAFMKKKR